MSQLLNVWTENSLGVKRLTGNSKLKQLVEILIWRIKGYSAVDYYAIPLYEVGGKAPVKISSLKYVEFEKLLNPRQTGIVSFDKWIQSNLWKG